MHVANMVKMTVVVVRVNVVKMSSCVSGQCGENERSSGCSQRGETGGRDGYD